jgi:hypothetical protein
LASAARATSACEHRLVDPPGAQVGEVHGRLGLGDLGADLVIERAGVVLRGDLGLADLSQPARAAAERADAEARERHEKQPEDHPDEEA